MWLPYYWIENYVWKKKKTHKFSIFPVFNNCINQNHPVHFFTWQKFFRFSVFVHIFRQLKITEFCFPIFWAKYLLSMTCIFHFKQLFLFSGVISWSATDQWMTWSSPVIWTSSIDEYFHLLISLFCVTITVFVQISSVICLHLIKPDHKFRNDCR